MADKISSLFQRMGHCLGDANKISTGFPPVESSPVSELLWHDKKIGQWRHKTSHVQNVSAGKRIAFSDKDSWKQAAKISPYLI